MTLHTEDEEIVLTLHPTILVTEVVNLKIEILLSQFQIVPMTPSTPMVCPRNHQIPGIPPVL
jgi:hypothetical protein